MHIYSPGADGSSRNSSFRAIVGPSAWGTATPSPGGGVHPTPGPLGVHPRAAGALDRQAPLQRSSRLRSSAERFLAEPFVENSRCSGRPRCSSRDIRPSAWPPRRTFEIRRRGQRPRGRAGGERTSPKPHVPTRGHYVSSATLVTGGSGRRERLRQPFAASTQLLRLLRSTKPSGGLSVLLAPTNKMAAHRTGSASNRVDITAGSRGNTAPAATAREVRMISHPRNDPRTARRLPIRKEAVRLKLIPPIKLGAWEKGDSPEPRLPNSSGCGSFLRGPYDGRAF